MSELRNNIKTNWTMAGQELGRELHKFWTGSRPASPAPSIRERAAGEQATSPTTLSPNAALSRLSHLDIPSGARGPSSDFAAGYSLGLIGGVRSWMSKSRRTLNEDRPESPDSNSDSDKSPKLEPDRGRSRRSVQEEVDAQVDSEMNSPRSPTLQTNL